MSQALAPKVLQIQNIQKLNFQFSLPKKLENYSSLPHHLELVVYLTQIQDDHLNDPESIHPTCSKAKICSKAEEASRP